MNSFIGWVGGKRELRKEIIKRFPPDDVGRYIEVFGGAAWVLFAKDKKPNQLEVYNDTNSDLVNLFRCVKYHCGELQRELEWLLTSRELFHDYQQQLDTQGLTDIQRAARFFYTVKISFGAKGESYTTCSRSVDHTTNLLKQVQKRLRGVNIEHKDFADLIRVYDRPNALFYLDPPYVGAEKYYQSLSFEETDHQRLKTCMDGLKGRFILSYNDCPLVRELYASYHIESVSRKAVLAGNCNNAQPYAEVIIRNY